MQWGRSNYPTFLLLGPSGPDRREDVMAQKRSRVDEEIERIAETVLDGLGFELVELERAGHRARPILRVRIDRPGSEPGGGVSVDDCAQVSRELEAVLDAQEDLATSYILEVSSPGVERPLRLPRDFERSLGREISVRGYEKLARGSKRLEGVLVGVEGSGGTERLRVRMADETEIEVPLSAVARANLVFRWEGSGLEEIGKKKSQS
jgi:ribosome maturation factor RimP